MQIASHLLFLRWKLLPRQLHLPGLSQVLRRVQQRGLSQVHGTTQSK